MAQAAMRELTEETGLVPSRIDKIDCSYSFPMRDEWKSMYPPGTDRITEHVFLALVDGGVEPTLSEEHDDWKWLDARQALHRLKYPGNTEALRQCAALLESGWG
jgi:8-oxo-dGTP pyrophosphatase MutT (NUDIX family)